MRTSMLQAVLAVTIVGMACSDDFTAPVTVFESVLIAANEVPATLCGTPAVACTGTATGSFTIGGTATAPTLSYSVTITAPVFTAVTQAHLHTGAAGANGAIGIWLCGTAGFAGPAGTPTCLIAGTANGVLITATGLAITTAQVTSLRAFGMYANVHTTGNTGGEIRGQARVVAP